MLVAALTAAGVFAYFQVSGRIIPGVRAGSMPLGGMTLKEAATALHQSWNVDRRILLGDGLQTWEIPPTDLGLRIDPGETVQNAYSVGHQGDLLTRAAHITTSMQDGWEIVPVILFDPSAARAGLEKLSEEASQPPTDASFYVQDGRLVPVPGQIGYTFNIDETLQRIQANPRAVLEDGLIAVSLKPVPPRIEDVSPAMAEAQRLLDTPVSLKAYDPITNETLDLPVSKENIGTWLRVEPGENMPVVTINEGSVTHTIAQMSEALGPDRWIDAPAVGPSFTQAVRDGSTLTALVRHNPTTYTIESGDTLLKIGWKVGMPFWMIQEANPGLDPENMWAGQQLTIPSKDDLLPLPVVMNKRIVISISEQRLWAYQDGQQVARHVISTGIDRSPTQPGVFQVQTHDPNAYASVWDLHMPDFLGIYEAWPGFMNGIHGLPTLSNGRRLWANILGRPASYGCIILDLDAAEWLYNWAEDGVVVEIQG